MQYVVPTTVAQLRFQARHLSAAAAASARQSDVVTHHLVLYFEVYHRSFSEDHKLGNGWQ